MNKTRESTFRFKQFSLSNNYSAMKVGTDGVLLGAWAQMPSVAASSAILDIGCGTGVIALMLAQRYPEAMVKCIDISDDAVKECAENIAHSPFAERVEVQKADFITYEDSVRYDLIVSNPPFFTEALHSPDSKRAVARHDDSLPLKLLIRRSVALLSDAGHLALVLPTNRESEVMLESSLAGLHLLRRCQVFTRAGKLSRRTLWEFSLSNAASCDSSQLFIQNSDGEYNKDYISLVKDFYINF